MSETEANKKNTSQPFSIDSDAGWASMSTLLDEKMPVLPVEDEKKKKRRGLIFFPVLAAASVIAFLIFTVNKTAPDHSKNGSANDVESRTMAIENKSTENIPQQAITKNGDPSQESGAGSQTATNQNTGSNNDNVIAVTNSTQNPATASATNTNINVAKINTTETGTAQGAKHSRLVTRNNTSSRLLYSAVIEDDYSSNATVYSNTGTTHNYIDTWSVLHSGTELKLNIADLSKSDVIIPDTSVNKAEEQHTAGKKDTKQKKNQFEWMAGAGVERGLKNKDLGYYFTSKVMFPISHKFSVSTGLVVLNGNGNVKSEDTYTKSFMTNTTDVKNVTKTTYFRNFNYISAPVQLVYKVKPQLYIGAGIQNSFLMKYKETENVELYDVNMNFLATYPTSIVDVGTIRMGQIEPATKVNKYDPRILATIGYTYKSLRLEINYEHGLKNAIRPIGHSQYSTSKTETLGLSLFYNIK